MPIDKHFDFVVVAGKLAPARLPMTGFLAGHRAAARLTEALSFICLRAAIVSEFMILIGLGFLCQIDLG